MLSIFCSALLFFFFFFLPCSCRELKSISENVGLLVFFNVSFSVSPSKPSSSLVSSQGTAHSELNVFLSTQYYTIFLECCAITSWARLSLCTPCREPDRLKSSNSIFRHVVLSERWHCRRFVHLPRNLPLSGIPRAGIWGLLVFVCSPVVPDVKPCLSQSAPAPPHPSPPAQSGAWVSVSVSPTPALV